MLELAQDHHTTPVLAVEEWRFLVWRHIHRMKGSVHHVLPCDECKPLYDKAIKAGIFEYRKQACTMGNCYAYCLTPYGHSWMEFMRHILGDVAPTDF